MTSQVNVKFYLILSKTKLNFSAQMNFSALSFAPSSNLMVLIQIGNRLSFRMHYRKFRLSHSITEKIALFYKCFSTSVFSKKIAKFHKIGKPYCETLGLLRTLTSSNNVENGYECGVG